MDPKKSMVRQAVVVILVCFGVYFLLIRPFWGARKALLEKEIEEKSALLKKYISKEGWAPSAEAYNQLAKANERLERDFKVLSEFIDPKRVRLPEDILEPRLYFKERLYGVKKRLDEGAKEKGVELPANLGFSEELPEPEAVPELLRRLGTVDSLVTLLIEKGATAINLIKPLETKELVDPQTDLLICKELPLQLGIECNTAMLVEFLYGVGKASPVLVVKDLKVKSGPGQSLKVDLLISEAIVK